MARPSAVNTRPSLAAGPTSATRAGGSCGVTTENKTEEKVLHLPGKTSLTFNSELAVKNAPDLASARPEFRGWNC